MKCIKSIKKTNIDELGKIARVPDNLAHQRVTSGYWKYISKTEWKDGGRVEPTQAETKKKKENLDKEVKTYKRKTKRK
jgi:hypothetical protein